MSQLDAFAPSISLDLFDGGTRIACDDRLALFGFATPVGGQMRSPWIH